MIQAASNSAQSSSTTADMMAAIETFLSIIPKHLADGKIVELGDFGNFGLRLNANGADTPGEVRGELVRTLLPHFRPGKEFKKVLRTAKIQKSRHHVER